VRNSVFLINSGAYIAGEIQRDFGLVSPVFLPLQGKALICHQIAALDRYDKIILTLPYDYTVEEKFSWILNIPKLSIVYVDSNRSLGNSILNALLEVNELDIGIDILHGDTFFHELPEGVDLYSISCANDRNVWAKSKEINGYVISGYFSFSSQKYLCQCLQSAELDFVRALGLYNNKFRLREVPTDNWFDFGHHNTFYQSKAKLTTERSFNRIRVNGSVLTKGGDNQFKILAESEWYRNIPNSIRLFTPAYYGLNKDSDGVVYNLQYLHAPTLSELYVFSRHDLDFWRDVIIECFSFLKKCISFPAEKIYIDSNNLYFKDKTQLRLNLFQSESGFNLSEKISVNEFDPVSINQIVDYCNKQINVQNAKYFGISHGDFCFSNILYDFNDRKIKVIDPRGYLVQGEYSIYGDVAYDVVKLSHSLIGYYDIILSGIYNLEAVGSHKWKFSIHVDPIQIDIMNFYREQLYNDFPDLCEEIYPRMIHLFLSMLPLHSDVPARQFAFICNSVRLYYEWKKLEK
jgi:hypothetical protein